VGHAHRVHRGVRRRAVDAAPEGQRPAQPLALVKREMLVGEGAVAARDPTCSRPQKPGGKAQQARLAGAVGAGHERRLAGAERQAQAFEQDAPAAPPGHVVELQQGFAQPA
jgi:hypothetical protein